MATQVSLTDGAVASAGALAIQTNGTTQAVSISTGQVATLAQNPILTSGTANGVAYLNGSKAVTSGSALVFDGTNLGVGVTPVGLDSRFKNVEVGPTASLSSILVSSTSLLTYLQHNSYVDSSGATKFKYTGGSNYASQYNQNNGSHLWQTSTAAGTGGNACTFTTNMTLDASGNLLVGQTSAGTASSGFSVGGGLVFASIPSGNNTYHVWDGTNSAYRFYVSAAGTISATNTTITSLSDVRLKENIRDLDDGLNVVMGLKPRKFDWKTGKGKDIKNDRGFIAQEFEPVLPDMIHEWLDNAPEGEEPYKAINANLIPTLVKAIQDQQALITQLQADVAALKGA